MSDRDAIEYDAHADVIVVGTGAAGFGAAVTAASHGLSVIMLEKADDVGGTTAESSGEYWVPNNSFLRAEGLVDPKPECLRYMARFSYPQLYDPLHPTLGLAPLQYRLLETYYDRGSGAIDHFNAIGALVSRFSPDLNPNPLGKPEYNAEYPDNRAPFGRHLLSLGGTHTSGQGAFMIEAFQTYALAHGVDIRTGHRVEHIFRDDDGRVVGLGATYRGTVETFGARRGVVFASGGFIHDPELARAHLRGRVYGGLACVTNTGDFLRLSTELGVTYGNMANAWWGQTPIEHAIAVPRLPLMNYFVFGDSMIQVNKYGQRVVNEKAVYHERAQVHFAWNPTAKEYSNLMMFEVYDSTLANLVEPDHWHKVRYPIPPVGQTAEWVIEGATWEELANNVNARLDQLHEHVGNVRLAGDWAATVRSTVARFNDYARTGVDAEFHRGETPIEKNYSPVLREGLANHTMAPFADEGPYYCIIHGVTAFDTCGGPQINEHAQVLDAHGEPIPGLYGAGNCVASPAGQAYWSGGTTLGSALIFGYIAGQHLAGVA